MRIGELAREVGVSADTVRFYERAGSLPPAPRLANDYREYDQADVEHLRLLIDLRRLEIPLDRAASIASWCHSGHCGDTSAALPGLIAEQRAEIARRISGLRSLDARLADLEVHLRRGRRALNVVKDGAPCCDAARAVMDSAEGGCACCAGESARDN
jgi:DNA-binding transcriptional MerR regulator